MKRVLFGAMVIAVVAVILIIAGVVAATARTDALHQSMYDTDTQTNSTKAVSGHASEHDGQSLITAGCLFLIIACIVAVAVYRTREPK